MGKITSTFLNEYGNEITMTVEFDHRGTTITAVGPTSTVEHTFTVLEGQMLRHLLDADERAVDPFFPNQ